jgi:hypothetical protein
MTGSPSIIPSEQDVYLLLDDFGGRHGRIWREADEADTTREAVIRLLLESQYSHPVLIVAFNISSTRSLSVSASNGLRSIFKFEGAALAASL